MLKQDPFVGPLFVFRGRRGDLVKVAAMTARMRLPDIEEKDKPKRRPIPDHIPRIEVELAPGTDACVDCGGRLRWIFPAASR